MSDDQKNQTAPPQSDSQQPQQQHQSPEQGGKQPEQGEQNKAEDKKPVNPRTKTRRIVIATLVAVIVLVGVLIWWFHSRQFEDTDDAQVDGHLHPISARVEGTVIAVSAEDNQPVNAGDLLVQLDPRDYSVALDQAKSTFDQARGQADAQNPNLPITGVSNRTNVSTGQTEVATAAAALAGSQQDKAGALAQLRQAEANNEKAQNDLKRYTRLLERNEVSQQDYDQYLATARAQQATVEQQQAALNSSEKMIDQKRAQLEEQRVRLQQSQTNAPRQVAIQKANIASSKANARNAQSRMDQAVLNLEYTRVYAPVSGIVTQRSAESGGKVSVGQQLMMVVQTDDLWVTANFRETQLREMHVGQHVTMHVDTLGRDFSGSIQNMPAASGDRTSVLPPENATGNYVKIVQRLPVRIRFDGNQDGLGELRPGMSVEPTVKVR